MHIDSPVGIWSCRLEFGPGAQIIVASGQSLFINNSKFYACSEMWKGITLRSNAKLSVYTSNIEDAQYAISTGPDAYLSLAYVEFNRNDVGIRNSNLFDGYSDLLMDYFGGNRFTCTSLLNSPYPGQTPEPGKISNSGILVEGGAAVIGKYNTSNEFLYLHYGIRGSDADIIVQGCQFYKMDDSEGDETGAGIYTEGGSLTVKGVYVPILNETLGSSVFQDCLLSGILTKGTELDIQDGHFSGIQVFGVRSVDNLNAENILIHNNEFHMNQGAFFGIYLQKSVGRLGGKNTVSNNEIEISGLESKRFGIFVDCALVSSLPLLISENTLNIPGMGSSLFGIFVEAAGSSNRNEISDNQVNFLDLIFKVERWGIVFKNLTGTENKITDNSITGIRILKGKTEYSGQCAIHIEDSRKVEVCDNTVNNTARGFHLLGNNDKSLLKNNNFNFHERGLFMAFSELTPIVLIGEQVRHGNLWSVAPEAYDLYAAEYASPLFLFSPFITESTNPAVLPPAQLLNPSQDWFKFESGSLNYCTGGGAPEKISSFDELSLNGNISNYVSGSNDLWEAGFQLMTDLYRDPGLLSQHYLASSYFNARQNTALGRLASIAYQLEEALEVPANMETDLDNIRLQRTEWLDSLIALENTYTDTLAQPAFNVGFLAAKKQAFAQLRPLYLQEKDQKTLIRQQRAQQWSAAAGFNQATAASTSQEQAYKTLFDYGIKRVLQSNSPADDAFIQALAAGQSPATDGGAVVLARAWLDPCAQVALLDDGAEGSSRGIQAVDPADVYAETDRMVLSPNPGDGGIKVIFPKGATGTLRVISPLGRVVLSYPVASETTAYIDGTAWPPGLYYFHLASPGSAGLMEKMVILR